MFYLPLTSEQAAGLASQHASEFFVQASLLESAAVLFIQNVPRQQGAPSVEAQQRRFAEIVRIADEVEAAAPSRFQQQVASRFDPEVFAMGLGMLGENGIGLLAAEQPVDVADLR